MTRATKHRSERLERTGYVILAIGAALFLFPALPPDPFATAHDLIVLMEWHWWLKFAGITAVMLGNTLRLIGVQGHPGLPWPLVGPRVPHDLIARIELRRRAWENRAKALAAGR